jgi:hypothetical protein
MSDVTIRKLIIRNALRDRAWLMKRIYHGPHVMSWSNCLWERARDGEVPYDPRGWLGRELTNAERIEFCRELARMSDEGLLVRVGLRTTRIALAKHLLKSGARPRRKPQRASPITRGELLEDARRDEGSAPIPAPAHPTQ